MIEQNIFDERFEVVAAHYGYKVTSPVSKLYYNYLSENLTTDKFVEATKKVMIQFPVRMGLPSPQEIVDIILGSKKDKALKEWQLIVAATSNNDRTQVAYLSNRACIALATIGGFDTVGCKALPDIKTHKLNFLTVFQQKYQASL